VYYFHTKDLKAKSSPLSITTHHFPPNVFFHFKKKIVPLKIAIYSSALSGYIFKENQNIILRQYSYLHVHCSIIHNSQVGKQPKYLLTGEWVIKRQYTYTMEYYSAFKKKQSVPIGTS
jgi:hypothetical protein